MITIEQKYWTKESGWVKEGTSTCAATPEWVLVFAGRAILEEATLFKEIREMYPSSKILSCSTAGEILNTSVRDNSVSLTAFHFEKTTLRFAEKIISSSEESFSAGESLVQELQGEELSHVMVFSDGLLVNGSKLIAGLSAHLPAGVSVTGALVGDGDRFEKTFVGLDEPGTQGKIVVIGFYGTALKIGYGSLGGWDPFGLERTITKSKDNILYELDNQPALLLYKKYLGEQAKDLPGSALLFPLRLTLTKGDKETFVVRTILGVNEKDQSMRFAGDMPEGVQATLMKANFERLIDGASGAGTMSMELFGKEKPDVAILVSCVGRKLVLKERIEEEVEVVQEQLGKEVPSTGLYSYGEICPVTSTEQQCELHNQTMTITILKEI